MRPRCQPAERSSLGKSPPGDGRSALLLPGFLAGDYTLATLAIWLRGIGYRPRRVGFLANVDCSDRALRAVETRAEDIVEEEALVRTWHRHTTDRRERGGCLTEDCRCSFTRDYSATFPESVRLTSVYSKRDGVVRWQSCVVPYADNVEVRGTHVGLALNPDVYTAIATALATPPHRPTTRE